MIRKLLWFVHHHKLSFAGALLLAALTILAGVGLMSSSGYLISRAAQRPMIVDLFMVTAAVRLFGISRAVVRYFERVVSHDFTFTILLSMRSLLYRKFDSLSLKWIMGRRPGDLLARIVTDIETLQQVYLRIVSPVIVAVIVSFVCCSLLWIFDPVLSLTTLGFLLLSGAALPLLASVLGKGRGRDDVVARAYMKEYLVDRLQGMQDVLWLGQKPETEKSFSRIQSDLDALHHKNAGVSGMMEGLHTMLAHLGAVMVLALSLPLLRAGEIQGVMLAMITLGVLSSFEAVQGLGHAFLHHGASAEAAKRFFSIVESKPALPVADPVKPLPSAHDITFDHVSFSYVEEHIAIQDISFVIPQGSKTAIVGPAGSGKTTLINLLLRFWRQQRGQITVGGIDIGHLDAGELRSLFSVVSQDAHIFNRSLRDNLLMAKPEATDELLIQALTTVQLGAFTNDLNREAGSLGMKLSGGERQLFALARALLKDAPVWILDEPTAHMDVNTERRILDAVWSAGHDATRIVITHRLVDMEKMDQILVMQGGRIAERGTHIQLMAGETLYRRMVDQQRQLIS